MPFSALQEKDYIGRQEELSALTKRVTLAQGDTAQSAVLSGQRGMGKTELLKQLFGRLFWRQHRVAPFYYAVNAGLLSVEAFSRNYLTRFLCQRLAYQKKEQALLYLDGISLADVSSLLEERGETWASEILNQYERSSGDPLDALRIALNAPYLSALATGTSVVVLIDEFPRLKGLHRGGVPEPQLVAFFEEPMSSGKTPHIITGNVPELQEMSIASGLERIPLLPLGPESMSSKAQALLGIQGVEGNVPHLLQRHLGGNPYYLGCVVKAACAKRTPDEKDFWNAYLREISEGALLHSWSAVLKNFFPDLAARRLALAAAHAIYHASEPLPLKRIARTLALTEAQASDTLQALYLAGLIRGEFGVSRAVDDRVVRDVIECLYLREILAKSRLEQEQYFLESLFPQQEQGVRYEITVPNAKESELVVAQCMEQIGKNLQLNEDTIGQMQIAVIEACINAIEHGQGADSKIRIIVTAGSDRLSVSIESAGPEFIVQETGEPFSDQEAAKASNRGWGIKLMKRFADEVTFERTPEGTRTVLMKKIGTPAGVRKEDATRHG